MPWASPLLCRRRQLLKRRLVGATNTDQVLSLDWFWSCLSPSTLIVRSSRAVLWLIRTPDTLPYLLKGDAVGVSLLPLTALLLSPLSDCFRVLALVVRRPRS